MGKPCRLVRVFAMVLALGAGLGAVGCGEDMSNQPRFEPLEGSRFFADGMASRPPVPGTVARGSLSQSEAMMRGVDEQGQPVGALPIPLTPKLLDRGRVMYDAVCANCHSRTGDGQGMIVLRGFPAPPSLHLDRLRRAPEGHLFNIITNGYGKMLPFSDQLTPRERWAVVAYVRALQRSAHATLDDVPPEARPQLEGARPTAKERGDNAPGA